jgi:hypothetical protein
MSQGAQKLMVAIASVGDNDIKAASYFTQSLDLGDTHLQRVDRTADALGVHRQRPTAALALLATQLNSE